ncbi:OmpA family protein [Nocardiopsis lambiniae]|uniref:OmpA family protein n=1 Tax=Nocardiopsis lambiniae TaxID=3075539 RepID=A0ABU2MI19_9ACTN|nr:OmpA family protein [Nocardiopsis sp. DSM 44743]MDT0331730.1 OmpA family protein [Nocardiopsis sp. DSM 44743]
MDGELVVMVDRSASLWESRETVLDPTEIIVEELADAAFYASRGGRVVTLGLFDGTSARSSSVSWVLGPSDIAESLVERDREEFATCLREEYLPTALAIGALSEGSDVVGALADGEGYFSSGGGEGLRRLVVVTDGRSNSGCADLNTKVEAWADAGDIGRRVVEDCRASGEWPADDLDGVEVTLRLRSNSQDGNGRQGEAWLADLWGEVCAASATKGCEVTAFRGVEGTGEFTDPPEQQEDPVVVLPVWSEPCRVQELNGDLLFPHDSATAHSEAIPLLDSLAEHNRECTDERVTVTGHTDSQGDEAYNERLSLKRAEYVADRLREHGFTNVSALGAGESEPVCPGDYDDNDDVDDPCPASNRRVVISFSDEGV